MANVPKQYEQIIDAAYGGMEIGEDWTKHQQKELVKWTRNLLPVIVGQHETPRTALQRIFALFSPNEGRAAWFMDEAVSKAKTLKVDLDDRSPFEGSVSASSMNIGGILHESATRLKNEFSNN